MSKKSYRVLSLAVVLFAGFLVARVLPQGIPPGSASTDTGLGGGNSITGTILVSNGQRILRRVTVRLQTQTRGDRLTISDEYGNFALRGLPPGEYTLVIDKEKEYEPFVQVVSLIQPRGMPGMTSLVSIRLKAKPGSVPKPAVVPADFAGVPKDALADYSKGVELTKIGKSREAIVAFEDAIHKYEAFTNAYNEMGAEYMRLGDLEHATAAFQNALKIDPKAFTPLTNLGIGLFHMKNYTAAEICFREALKLQDGSVIVHHFLGKTLANQGKFNDAEPELVTAIKLGGDDMKEDHRLLAIIYNARGDKKKAIEELETI